jgi:uncharacterized protein YndB with AHSA1/START domain
MMTPEAFTLDRATNTIRFERHVDATPADVFDAWTKPDEISAWWDPDGRPLVACDIDLRVGGAFSFATAEHTERPFAGVYREIARPTKLVFDAMGATGTVTLAAADGGTRMVVEIVCSSKQHLDQFVQLRVHEGTARTMDNLVGYARRRSAAAE